MINKETDTPTTPLPAASQLASHVGPAFAAFFMTALFSEFHHKIYSHISYTDPILSFLNTLLLLGIMHSIVSANINLFCSPSLSALFSPFLSLALDLLPFFRLIGFLFPSLFLTSVSFLLTFLFFYLLLRCLLAFFVCSLPDSSNWRYGIRCNCRSVVSLFCFFSLSCLLVFGSLYFFSFFQLSLLSSCWFCTTTVNRQLLEILCINHNA